VGRTPSSAPDPLVRLRHHRQTEADEGRQRFFKCLALLHVVGVDFFALEILVEPTDNVLQPFDTMLRSA